MTPWEAKFILTRCRNERQPRRPREEAGTERAPPDATCDPARLKNYTQLGAGREICCLRRVGSAWIYAEPQFYARLSPKLRF
ncbi:unnamed protein product [Diplocarpon coronariae]